MRRRGGGASFCDPGFGRARNEKPPDGVPGVGFGGAGGMDGSGSGGRGHPPREIPPRGVSGLLLGAECGRLKRRLPVLLRCQGGAIGPPER